MHECIDLTVSRTGITICIRKNTHQYSRQATFGSRKSSKDEGQDQQYGPMQSYESNGNVLILSKIKPEYYHSDINHDNKDNNQNQKKTRSLETANFHKSSTKSTRNTINNYNRYNFFRNSTRINLNDGLLTNSPVNYTSETEKSLISSDYDADDEDIETKEHTDCDKKCMENLCDSSNKNSDINLEEKSMDLKALMEYINVNDKYNSADKGNAPEKDLYLSNEKFNRQLKKMCYSQHKGVRRQKRATDASPQLALLIPMINEINEINQSGDSSVKVKRCIRKKCRKSLCQSLGCYANKSSYETISPQVSYENRKEMKSERRMPLIYSHDVTSNRGVSYPEIKSSKVPIHNLKFASRQRTGKYHKEHDILRNKLSKSLVHYQERQNEKPNELHDKSSLYDDLKDYDSSVSLQTRLEDTAHYLKKLLEENKERRNQKRPPHLNIQHQMTYFPHTTSGNSDSQSQDSYIITSIERDADEYLSLPKAKQMQNGVLNDHEDNKFYLKTESETFSTEHGNINSQTTGEVELDSMSTEVKNNQMYSSLYSSTNVIKQPNLGSEEGYLSAKDLQLNTGQIQERVAKDNPQIKDNVSKFNYLYSKDNQFPLKLNNSAPIFQTHNYSQPAITSPIQIVNKPTTDENSGILQQMNMQEIYKNLPPNYEFSAGQWIHVQPSEGIHLHSDNIKPVYQEENERETNNSTRYDYNNIYSQPYNQFENKAEVAVKKISKTSEKHNLAQKLENNTDYFQGTTTNVAEQDLNLYRSLENVDSTELNSPYNNFEKNKSNIKIDRYSIQDDDNLSSKYSTQLTAPLSFVANVESNENMSEKNPEFTAEKMPSTLRSSFPNSQHEKFNVLNLEKKWGSNNQLYSPKYQNNMQYYENVNDTTNHTNYQIDKNYFRKITESLNNKSDEKVNKYPFEENQEPTTGSNIYHYEEKEILDTNLPSSLEDFTKTTAKYSIPSNELELQRDTLHFLSKETSKNKTRQPERQKNTKINIEEIHSKHNSTNKNSNQQYPITSPRDSNTPNHLKLQTEQNEQTERQVNKISQSGFTKFVSDSDLHHEQIAKTSWNGTQHDVVDMLNKMLEYPEEVPNIESSTPYYSSERTSKTDKAQFLTEGTSQDILHSGTHFPYSDGSQSQEHIQSKAGNGNDPYISLTKTLLSTTSPQASGTEELFGSNSQEKTNLYPSPESIGETPSLWYVEDDGRNERQNFQPISLDHTNYPKIPITQTDLPLNRESTETTHNRDDNKGNIFRLHDPRKSSVFENSSQSEEGSVFGQRTNNLLQNFTLEAMPTNSEVSEQNEYSGTILIVDPSTGAVTETIPVTGRFLSFNSEKRDEEPHVGVSYPLHEPDTSTYLLPNSQESYQSTFYRDEFIETNHPQTHKHHTDSLPQFNQPIPFTNLRKNEGKETEFSLQDHSIEKEKIKNVLPKKDGTNLPADSALESINYSTQRNYIPESLNKVKLSPSYEAQTYEPVSKNMDDNSQGKNDSQKIALKLPSKINVTCVVKDLPCEIAKDDVYSNFFTVMLKEMQKFGEGNCTSCTNNNLISACEKCIRKLINERVSDESINDEVQHYAVDHCPKLEETDSRQDPSSTSPYAKCKFKFIADLTSLFGLWLRAITNSR